MIEELEDEDEVDKEEVDSEEEEESFQEINEDEDGEMEEEMFSTKKRKTKSILPIDKTFSASLFLSLIHRELTFEDLKGMYVRVHVSSCVCMHVCVRRCVCICMYVHVYVCMYGCMYVCVSPFSFDCNVYVYYMCTTTTITLCLIRFISPILCLTPSFSHCHHFLTFNIFNKLDGLNHLKGQLRSQSFQRENLVRTHFGLFVHCAEGLEWLKAYRRGGELVIIMHVMKLKK